MKMPTKLTLALLGIMLLSSFLLAQGRIKTPVPDQAAQAKSLQLVLDIFGDDLKMATTSEALTKLAAYLLQQGKEVKDDPATRFVCYREARLLAAKAADANLALSAIDETSRVYDVDAMMLKAETLNLVVASAKDKEAGAALIELIRPLLNEAVDLDNYKAAHLLGEAVINAAKKARSPSLVLDLQKRLQEIGAIEKNFSKLHVYLERIEKNPNDGAANLEVGSYFGFQKKRWGKALPYFAMCSDASLQTLAKKDLGQPTDAKQQLALADGWWERAGKDKGPIHIAMQMRAMYWYDKALPGLTGLSRTKAQKRVELVQDQLTGTTVALPAAGPAGEFKKFEGHSDEIKGVALSADGHYAVSGSRDQTVRVWDLATGKEAHVLRGHTKEVWAVGFHPNSRNVFSTSWDATARMWDIKTSAEVKRWTHSKDVNGLALSRDANMLLTGSDDEKAYLWNVNTGEEIRRFTGATNYVYAVAFAPDGRHIATGGVDKTVRIYDMNASQAIKTFDGHTESVTYLAFTSDSRYVLSSGDSVVHIWDLTTGKEAPRRFEGHQGRIPALAISPDGRRLATGSDDRTIKIWDVTSGKMLHTFAGHTDTITCVAFSADGRRLVSGSYDRSVRVWNLPR